MYEWVLQTDIERYERQLREPYHPRQLPKIEQLLGATRDRLAAARERRSEGIADARS